MTDQPAQRFDWPDFSHTGLATVHSRHVTWDIVELFEGALMGGSDTQWFWRKGEPSVWSNPTEDPALADVIVSIGVKWDGCANYHWNDEINTHTCDGGGTLFAVIRRVHELTAQILPTWDEVRKARLVHEPNVAEETP